MSQLLRRRDSFRPVTLDVAGATPAPDRARLAAATYPVGVRPASCAAARTEATSLFAEGLAGERGLESAHVDARVTAGYQSAGVLEPQRRPDGPTAGRTCRGWRLCWTRQRGPVGSIGRSRRPTT